MLELHFNVKLTECWWDFWGVTCLMSLLTFAFFPLRDACFFGFAFVAVSLAIATADGAINFIAAFFRINFCGVDAVFGNGFLDVAFAFFPFRDAEFFSLADVGIRVAIASTDGGVLAAAWHIGLYARLIYARLNLLTTS